MTRRQVAAFALLGAEVIGLTVRFDTGATHDDFLASLLVTSRIAFQVLVVAAAVALLFGLHSQTLSFRRLTPVSEPSREWFWGALLAHLVILAGFVWMTAVVVEGGEKSLNAALAWGLSWAGLALVTFVSWICIWFPPARWRLSVCGGPLLLLGAAAAGLAAWGAGRITIQFWEPLCRSTLASVHWLLRLCFAETVIDPARMLIGTPRFHVQIGPPCSGYEGVGLMLVLIGAFVWIHRDELRFPHALILLPIGEVIIWAVNSLRLAGLISLGTFGYRKVAFGGFHSVAGWIGFTVVGLGVIAAARSWSFIHRHQETSPARTANPSAPYLVPMIAVLAVELMSRAFTEGFDWFYPARVVVAACALWYFRSAYGPLRWSLSGTAVGIGVAVFLVWVGSELWVGQSLTTPGTHGASQGTPHGPALVAWLIFRVLGSVVTVPLVEELAFRGYLTRRLVSQEYWTLPVGHFTWPSFLVSSAVFGLLHRHWLVGTLSGMMFALALYRRRELTDAVVAHATTNLLIAAVVLFSGNGSLWF